MLRIMKKRIIRYKVYYDRSGQYINYVKNLIIIAMAYKLYEDSKIGIWVGNHWQYVVPMIVVGYIGLRIVIGFIDKRMKIREYEMEEYNFTNPNIRMIQRYLVYIKQILDDNSASGEHTQKGGDA